MRTNVDLDDVLVKKAMKITQISTKKAPPHGGAFFALSAMS
jgi:hypothetical protein